jgi:hypothetical protein
MGVQAMTDLWKDKMAAFVWTVEGGALTIHVNRDWTAEQITSHADGECLNAFGGRHHVRAMEISDFGKIGRPRRRFERNDAGEWVEVPVRRWSKQELAAYHKKIADAVEQASRELKKPPAEGTAGGQE